MATEEGGWQGRRPKQLIEVPVRRQQWQTTLTRSKSHMGKPPIPLPRFDNPHSPVSTFLLLIPFLPGILSVPETLNL